MIETKLFRGPGDYLSNKTVLAVASGGGHWEQLMLLRPALMGFRTHYATTNADLAAREGLPHVHKLPDCNRNRPFKVLQGIWATWRLVRKIHPEFVITTGALPGLLCLIAAKLNGARTIWIDSLANCEQPSMSGRCARRLATLWLTQWAHLAEEESGQYAGTLL